jgi:hypothetical protein
MAESITKCALLDDVDEDTFIRFCEYAYTGNYSLPARRVAQMESKPSALEPEQQSKKPDSNSPSEAQPHWLNGYGEAE